MAHGRHHLHYPRATVVQESPDFNLAVKRSPSNSNSSPKCTPGHTSPGCVFPTNNSPTLPIVLGVLIPLTFALVSIIFLHRRNKKRQRIEDANDKHASLDYGLGEVSRSKKMKKMQKGRTIQPEMMDLNAEREFRYGRGMSMDMGSPYVLPGELAESRSSFHSLSRSAHDQEDPYRPVALIRSGNASPVGPSRNTSKKDSASLWTQSSDGTSRHLLRPRQASSALGSPIDIQDLPPHEIIPAIPPIEISQPTPVVLRKPAAPNASTAARSAEDSQTILPFRASNSHNTDSYNTDSHNTMDEPVSNFDFNVPLNDFHNFPSIEVTASEDDPPAPYDLPKRMSSRAAPINEEPRIFNQNPELTTEPDEEYTTYADVLGIVQKETSDEMRPTMDDQQVGLGVYGFEQNQNRLSASFRPLPPDDPSDNPEARANRIRSFYREYFDEAKGGGGNYGYNEGVEYYEDYGQEYLDGATVFDPETGQFIVAGNMPYAEPVTRRAMTPPPRAPPRFGGGSLGGGHRQYASAQFGPGGQRARGFSSASGGQGFRGRAAARRPMPPPAPLTNLPTPYLLKNDTAIFSATDFAPPSSVRDRAAGRPNSPFADRRPYSPSVRAYTPLASPFDDLPVMPSPHHLRKSGTFTALDFAPPARLKNDGAGSDAGSIRSGRSNMSASQLASIRAGAYRVSRIPKDYVGTRDDFAQALRPTWDQRGPTS